ncbi:hypothetical protein FBEOM_5983 [Fusarium beomiforme]|uniref:Hydrophobin n=1 Tax=Fusarium beomiforme TaxID=44412 RepID=A0A9P5DWM4_9HYPO|nr:hypothetical protein FBEOM_5983 [Fusarium beomiforme]
MKASIILSLPVLAIAAATPQIEERQLPNLPTLPPLSTPLDPTCLLTVPGIKTCLPDLNDNSVVRLLNIIGCSFDLVVNTLKCAVKVPLPGTK